MVCGSNQILNQILNLEDMKNMSIDEIVELYRNGYKIENLQTCEDIGCVSPDRYNRATQFTLAFGTAAVFLSILGVIGMVVTYYAGRESCKEKKTENKIIKQI